MAGYSLTLRLGGRTVLLVANHYLSIGFPTADRMRVVELLRRVISEGTSETSLDGGRHIRLHDHQSGARVSMVLDQGGTVRSAKPSFAPAEPRRVPVRVTGLHPDPANHDADLVQVAPLDASYPLAVEFEDGSRAINALCFGEETELELVGFADAVETYRDEADYRSSGMPLDSKSVLPAGLVPMAEPSGVLNRPRATALVSGLVLSCERRHNAIGGAAFLHLVIETDGMVFDAVVAPDAVEGPFPEPGQLLTGSMWFVARQAVPVPVGAMAAATVAAGEGATASSAISAPHAAGPIESAAASIATQRQSRPRLFRNWQY